MMSYHATTSWVVLSAPPAPEPLFPILLPTIQDGGHLVAFVQNISTVKDDFRSVLRISSTHNIAQIYIFRTFLNWNVEFIIIYKHSEPEKC